MTRLQAIAYAVKKIPEILPLEENDVRALCEQVLQNGGSNSDLVAQGFLDILGHEDAPFEFVIEFNQLLAAAEPKKAGIPAKQAEEGLPPSTTRQVKNTRPASKAKSTRVTSPKIEENNKKSDLGQSKVKSKAQRKLLLEEIDDAWKFLELEHDEKEVKKYACNCQGKLHPLFEVTPNCLSCGKIICASEGLHLNSCPYCEEELIPLEEKLKIINLLKQEKENLNNETKKVGTIEQSQKTGNRKKYANSYKISSGMGTNLFTEQDKLFDLIERKQEREKRRKEVLRLQEENEKEVAKIRKEEEKANSTDPELLEAQERLDKLLHFQDTSAERTKIIDNASDFSISDEAGLWGSAQQRALMIKKQQRNLKNFEKLERERNGKRDKYVVSMDIGPDGKLTMKEVVRSNRKSATDSDEDLDVISDDDDKKDINEIKSLKNEIAEDGNRQQRALQSRVWDYEKYGKQFSRLKYVGTASTPKHENHKSEPQNAHYRVQIDESDENLWERIV